MSPGIPASQRWSRVDLAEDLRILTRHRGLSVTEAARQLGVSRATAYRALGQDERTACR